MTLAFVLLFWPLFSRWRAKVRRAPGGITPGTVP
jgi:hypothetical protein